MDGPHHYTQKRQATGMTVLKRRQLRALGWAVIHVPYFEWQELRGNKESECAFMRQKLERAFL